MANQIKKSKPTSPGRRFRSWVSREGLHKGSGFQALLESKKQKSGRNNKAVLLQDIEGEVIRKIIVL
jgi:ribosomal protein L2